MPNLRVPIEVLNPFFDSALFYPDFSAEDKARLYSVFGGIPYYNKFVDPSMSVRENIMNLLVESGSRLENEVPLYLSSEISKITNANKVLGRWRKGTLAIRTFLTNRTLRAAPLWSVFWTSS